MELVENSVLLLKDLFQALGQEDFAKVEEIATKIAEFEHAADLTKNDIRNQLTKNIYIPMEKSQVLDILTIQDSLADRAEDIGVLLSIKPLPLPAFFKETFELFLAKNLETFKITCLIMKEMHELLDFSFGGVEAEKVRVMVEDVAYREHEVDLIQRKLLKILFQNEDQMSYGTFFLWQKICSAIGSISNLSENLAYRIRMTLELKK